MRDVSKGITHKRRYNQEMKCVFFNLCMKRFAPMDLPFFDRSLDNYCRVCMVKSVAEWKTNFPLSVNVL